MQNEARQYLKKQTKIKDEIDQQQKIKEKTKKLNLICIFFGFFKKGKKIQIYFKCLFIFGC